MLPPMRFVPGILFHHILAELRDQGCRITRRRIRFPDGPHRVTVIERDGGADGVRTSVTLCKDGDEMTATLIRSVCEPLGFTLTDVGYDFLEEEEEEEDPS